MGGDKKVSVWRALPDDEILIVEGRPSDFWIMELFSEYSQLQLQIQWVIQMRLERLSPKMAKVIGSSYLDRISDKECWRLIKALARDVGYEERLEPAGDAFAACKLARDALAHALGRMLVREPDENDYFYKFTHAPATKIPEKLKPSDVRDLVRNCEWLKWFVHYIGYLGGVRTVSPTHRDGSLVMQEMDILEPPALPVAKDVDLKNYAIPRESREG